MPSATPDNGPYDNRELVNVTITPPPFLLLCLGPCHGEFYLPLDSTDERVCPNDRDHPVAIYCPTIRRAWGDPCEECGHPLAGHRGDGVCLHCGCTGGSVWAEVERLRERECERPCCVEARERKAAWAEYVSLVRIVVRARTGQRIVGREPPSSSSAVEST